MNRGAFRAKVNTAWSIIKTADLDFLRNWNPVYPEDLLHRLRRIEDYEEEWRKCCEEQYFDFQLTDYSLIQLHLRGLDPLWLNYRYYPTPRSACTYPEWLQELGFDLSTAREYFREEYSQYVLDSDYRHATPVRYDYDERMYKPGVHPVSHIHFGYESRVRVATEKILNPVSFVLFIIRQFYPQFWADIVKLEESETWCSQIREKLADIPDEFWGDPDEKEHRLR